MKPVNFTFLSHLLIYLSVNLPLRFYDCGMEDGGSITAEDREVLHGDTLWVPENLLAKEYRALRLALCTVRHNFSFTVNSTVITQSM